MTRVPDVLAIRIDGVLPPVLRVGKNKGEAKMKHIKTVSVAKADVWSDVGNWFEDAWTKISDFFKGN